MFAKRLLQRAVRHSQSQQSVKRGNLNLTDLDPQIAIHYGIPSSASILAFDFVQRLLAVGTLDGRIKIIGGDGIEGLLISPKQLPYKSLEFLQNQGFLVSISNDNDIQVWNLENRCIACCSQWQTNITAFSVISGSNFMYFGDEYGLMSVMKYDGESEKLLQLPYMLSADLLTEAAGNAFNGQQPIAGILPQPCSLGNRVLIAYESGLIILWDVSEDQFLFVGGGKDLQLKDGANSPIEVGSIVVDDTSECHLQEKEISSLCWASSDGSILAVGYVDGDILFWNTSTDGSIKGQQTGSSKNVVKLQLSSEQMRLPIIALHWSTSSQSSSVCDGQLFIYGGDGIGSEEVITVLGLEWSSGTWSLKCCSRVDLALSGSFADIILVPSSGTTGSNHQAYFFVLTNPGKLHLYDGTNLPDILTKQEKKPSFCVMEYHSLAPLADPSMTVAKFFSTLPTGGNSSNGLSEIASVTKFGSMPTLASRMKWPLTGGVPSQLSLTKHNCVSRMYIAGYKDGSVRIWDATCSVLSLICVLEGKVQGIKVAGLGTPVSTLNFCVVTSTLAVGNECGLVHLYDLKNSSEETSFNYVTETKHEVHHFSQAEGPRCRSVFGLANSSVQAIEFAKCGAKLAVGYESGHVALLDKETSSVLFFLDYGSTIPIISLTWMTTHTLVKTPKHSEAKVPVNQSVEVLFILTKDSHVRMIDAGTGNMISSHPVHLKKEAHAISMYVLEGGLSISESNKVKQTEKKDMLSTNTYVEIDEHEKEQLPCSETAHDCERFPDALVLLCCENQMKLYSEKSVIQGSNQIIRKVKHARQCCWTTTFKKDEEGRGLVLLFQTGDIEIRSLPDLELVKETSLLSILRWNFKTNMHKTMSASDSGQISLANGSEVAFISLLFGQNDFSAPESLPCLHDKVLAAAADATFFLHQKKKKGTPGILGGIVKGFKGGKVDIADTLESRVKRLDDIFSKCPILEIPPTVTNNKPVVELNIDDIEIDETPHVAAASSDGAMQTKKGKSKVTEREKLLGPSDDPEPRLRTPQEIMATYRKAGDASSAATNARNKLLERQQKLEKISRRTEELQRGAEDFASLANELVKTMENRKWWHI